MTDYNLRIKLLRTLSAFIPLLEERELVIVDDKGIGQTSANSSLKVYDPDKTDIKQLYKTMRKPAKFAIEQPQTIREGTTYFDKTDYTLKRYNGTDWEIIGHTIDLDNNLDGVWTRRINIPILTPPSEDIQYKIEINGDNILVYSNDGTTVLTSGNGGFDFWNNVQPDGKDIRVCDEAYEQNYFWIEIFDYTNKKTRIWVKLNAGQDEVNIAYGNDSCLVSTYNDVYSVLTESISNLIGCWHFDEGMGTTTHDFSGQGHDGILKGSVSWTTNGYYGNALSFSGGYVDLANSNHMSGYSQLTIICRVYPTKLESNGVIYNKGACYELYLLHDGKLKWDLYRGSKWTVTVTDITLSLNTWYTIAWVYESADSIKTYAYDKDGNLRIHTGSWDGEHIGTSTHYTFKIGGLPGYNVSFNGIIDEVYMFDRALTQTEIEMIRRGLCRGDNNGNLLTCKYLSSDISFGTPTVKIL